MTHQHDAWLQDAALGLRESIDLELETETGTADLADVLARARALDADAVPTGLSVPAGSDTAVEDLPDLGLAPFVDALRDEVEDDVQKRAMQPSVEERSRTGLWIGLIATAAAVIAVFGAQTLGAGDAMFDDERGPASSAAKVVHEVVDDDAFTQREPEPRRLRSPVAEPEPEAVEVIEVVDPEPEPEPEPEPKATKRVRRTLDELEREAMIAWKSGQLGRAETLLRKIIARGGRGTKAELAYGDLFALAKQRGGRGAQRRTWKQYLQRFPKGRYADDARAGLCKGASDDAQKRCWEGYLAKHPAGSHAARARRTLEAP